MAAGSGHRGVEIQIALFRHVEKVNDQHIQRQFAVAVSLRNGQELVLRGINCLALNVAVRGFRQHVRDTSELTIALVDLVAVISRNYKKGNTVSHL